MLNEIILKNWENCFFMCFRKLRIYWDKKKTIWPLLREGGEGGEVCISLTMNSPRFDCPFLQSFLASYIHTEKSFPTRFKSTGIRCYLPFFDKIGAKQNFVRFQIQSENGKYHPIPIDLTRFRKDFSVCTYMSLPMQL